jgi:hypothetical protein
VLGAGYLAVLAAYLGWRVTIVDWDRVTGFPALLTDALQVLLTAMLIGVGCRPACAAQAGPRRPSLTADIFIPTLSEPLAIIEATALGALRVRGRGQVWILDDGGRANVAGLAHRLGTRYLCRASTLDAKAGNLNAALPHCTADLLLILDADQIPLPGILDCLLPFFADPAVAVVQTPQGFYNTDSVGFRSAGLGRWTGEQDLFYYWLQPAKNADNSAFWIGSGGVLRRSALLDIGGFATAITEDAHTTLRLHARGWRSVYVPGALSYGLEAGNLHEYYRQRRRWAAGNLFILFRTRDSPLCLPGLTLAQRLHYLCALSGHLSGLQRLLACLLLMLYLATGQSSVTVPFAGYAVAAAGIGLSAMAVTKALAKGQYHPISAEVLAAASMLPQAAGFISGAVAANRRFSASRKVVSRVAPPAVKQRYRILLALLVAGLAIGGYQLLVRGPSAVIIWAAAWTGYHATLLGLLLRHVGRAESLAPGPYEGLAPAALYEYVVRWVSAALPAPAANVISKIVDI